MNGEQVGIKFLCYKSSSYSGANKVIYLFESALMQFVCQLLKVYRVQTLIFPYYPINMFSGLTSPIKLSFECNRNPVYAREQRRYHTYFYRKGWFIDFLFSISSFKMKGQIQYYNVAIPAFPHIIFCLNDIFIGKYKVSIAWYSEYLATLSFHL